MMPSDIKRTLNSDSAEYRLKLVLRTLLKWWLGIFSCAVIFAVFGTMYANTSYTPTYTANGTMVAITQQGQESVSASEIMTAKNLALTYSIILKSDAMMQEISTSLQIDIPTAVLKNMIGVRQINESEIMQVTATSANKDLSIQIVNSLIRLAPKVIANTYGKGSVTMIDPAQRAILNTVSKDRVLYSLIGALLGLLFSVSCVFVIEFFRDTITTVQDISNKLESKTIGIIPMYAKKAVKGKSFFPVITTATDNFAFTEAYKSLRTRIEMLAVRNNYKRILITSSAEQEGKSTICINLSLALAQKGKSVILVDADLRNPSIDDKLGIKQKKGTGLSAILSGISSIDSSIYHASEHGFDVLLSGKTSEKPSELLGNEVTEHLLNELDKRYDYIIIDTPPTSFLTDALVLSEKTDMTFMVIKHDRLSKRVIAATLEEFQNVDRPVMGCILNYVRYSISGLGYYRYGYAYGKKYYKKHSSYMGVDEKPDKEAKIAKIAKTDKTNKA